MSQKRIPQAFLNDLLNRVDIVEIIGSRVALKKKGADFTARCPFHEEKTPSFSVSPNKQFYYCFGCAASGNAIGFLMAYDHMTFMDAVEHLAAKHGVELPKEYSPKEEIGEIKAYEDLMERACTYYQTQLKQTPLAQEYLKKRGLSPEIIQTLRLGFAPAGKFNLKKIFSTDSEMLKKLTTLGLLNQSQNDYFFQRILFPIRNKKGQVIAFGGRVLGEGMPKYLNSPDTPLFHKSYELYGLFEARQACRKLDQMIVVEGYMDAATLIQYDIKNVVATLGTATTLYHIQTLLRYTTEIIFCFDGDSAGQRAAWRALTTALPLMRDGLQIRFLSLPKGEDPDTFLRQRGKDTFLTLLSKATPLDEFLFAELRRQSNQPGLAGQAKLGKEVREQLVKMPHGIYKQLLSDKLNRELGIELTETVEITKTPSPQTTPTKSHARKTANIRSPALHALQLLLNHLPLAQSLTDVAPLLASPDETTQLLGKMLRYLQQHPATTLAALFSASRDTEQMQWLLELAHQPILIPESGYEAEFLASIEWLTKQERPAIQEFNPSNLSQMSQAEKKAYLDKIRASKKSA